MPPKGKPGTPPAPTDAGTDGVQLEVLLSHPGLTLALQVEEGAEAQPVVPGPAAPTLEACVHDASSAPDAAAAPSWTSLAINPESGTYPLAAQQAISYRLKPAELLDKLLGTTLRVTLRAADTKDLVASGTLDLLPLCLGEPSLEAAVELTRAPGSPFQLAAAGAVQAQARLLQDVPEPAGGAPDARRPLQLMTREEAAGCNVLQLLGARAAPAPAGFAAAANVAGGALTCTLALSLPGDAPTLVAAGGTQREGALVWDAGPRLFLAPAAVQQLKDALELGRALEVEVARYLGPGAEHLADPAFGTYHAVLTLAADPLAEPGCLRATLTATPQGTAARALSTGGLAASRLPPYVPPAGSRARAIDDAPAPDTEAPCAWQASGTAFHLELCLARPLHPAWQPPPPPAKGLRELLPERPPPPPPPEKTALQLFQEEVRALAQDLAAECRSRLDETRPAAGEGGGGAALAAAQQQALVYHMNKSGRYLAAKEQLKAAVLRVVAASRTTDELDEAGVARLSSQLYAQLMVEVRAALDGLRLAPGAAQQQQQQQGASPVPQAMSPERCLQLADEYEAAGSFVRCHQLHQRRVLATGSDPEALVGYGSCCLRLGDRGRAEACLRDALAAPGPQHPRALLLLVALLLEVAQQAPGSAGGAEPDLLEQVAALSHGLKEADGGSALGWALLGMAHRLAGKAQEAAARSCHQEVLRLAKTAASDAAAAAADAAAKAAAAAAAAAAAVDAGPAAVSASEHVSEGGGPQPEPCSGPAAAAPSPVPVQLPAAANGYLAAGQLAIDLKLAGLARTALKLAAGVPDSAGGWRQALQAAQAQLAALTGDAAGAAALLKQLVSELDASGSPTTQVHALLGGVSLQEGLVVQAKQHYRRALAKAGAACPAAVQLRLARCFADTGDVSAALDAFLAVAATDPRCLTAWLGAGAAYLRLQDYRSADLALCEANRLDPENADVWGHLALLAWLTTAAGASTAEAEQATATAMRLGLSSPPLLMQLADQAQAWGSFARAAALLAAAGSSGRDSISLRCKRAAVALAECRYEEAHAQLAAAARLPGSSQEAAMLEDICAKLKDAWPHL